MASIMHRLTDGDAATLARRLCAGRAAIATGVLVAPEHSVRAFGCDTATARRVTWLTRMLGIRDLALGVGGLAAARGGGDVAPWLVGGAVSDGVDALVVAAAARRGALGGPAPALIPPLGLAAAAAGLVVAARLRR